MHAISAFFNIVAGVLSWRSGAYRRHNVPTLTWLFSCLFLCLPKQMQRPIHFSTRYASKWGFYQKSSANIKLGQIPRHHHRGVIKKEAADMALVNALLYDIVVLIAPKVHYVDLVNMSMTSKRVRATMFPTTEEKVRYRQLRLYSCYGNTKSECWICHIQICNVSSPSSLVGLKLRDN